MVNHIATLLFFPDWTNGFPSDFLILHLFVGSIVVPFIMINRRAREFDSSNTKEAATGYKDGDNSSFFGYEKIN